MIANERVVGWGVTWDNGAPGYETTVQDSGPAPTGGGSVNRKARTVKLVPAKEGEAWFWWLLAAGFALYYLAYWRWVA